MTVRPPVSASVSAVEYEKGVEVGAVRGVPDHSSRMIHAEARPSRLRRPNISARPRRNGSYTLSIVVQVAAVGALDELLLIIVPILVFRITYGLARGRKPRPGNPKQR